MSLSARAKAVRGVGYASMLVAVQGLAVISAQPPAIIAASGHGGAGGGFSESASGAGARLINRQNEAIIVLILSMASQGVFE